MRGEGNEIGRGVGVGDDESEFGGKSGRVWFEWMEEARERLLALFEHSVFERVPGLQRFVRHWLGRPAKALPAKLPPPRPTGPLGAHTPNVDPRDEAYIRRRLMAAHVSESAGLRDAMAQARSARPPADDDDS